MENKKLLKNFEEIINFFVQISLSHENILKFCEELIQNQIEMIKSLGEKIPLQIQTKQLYSQKKLEKYREEFNNINEKMKKNGIIFRSFNEIVEAAKNKKFQEKKKNLKENYVTFAENNKEKNENNLEFIIEKNMNENFLRKQKEFEIIENNLNEEKNKIKNQVKILLEKEEQIEKNYEILQEKERKLSEIQHNLTIKTKGLIEMEEKLIILKTEIENSKNNNAFFSENNLSNNKADNFEENKQKNKKSSVKSFFLYLISKYFKKKKQNKTRIFNLLTKLIKIQFKNNYIQYNKKQFLRNI